MRENAISDSQNKSVSRRIRDIAEEVIQKGYTTSSGIFAVGALEKRIKDFAASEGIVLDTGDSYGGKMYFSGKQIEHAVRADKRAKGLDVSPKALSEFPRKKGKMDLYWDGSAFIYTDYKNKFIVRPNYRVKIKERDETGKKTIKTRLVNFITATKVTNPAEFSLAKYRKIK